jgi:nucleotide-binding universal stress UspA family protein
MRWFVGVDLYGRSPGALRWCRFVAEGQRGSDDRFTPVHVVEDRDLGPLRAHVSLAELERMSRESATTAVADAGAATVCDPVKIVHDTTADAAFAEIVAEVDDAIVVLGRRARREGQGWVRLGRVARRLIRHLPCPVVVVPPDLTPEDLGDGPIVLATSMEEDSDGAADMTKRLAARWNREVLVVHVVPSYSVGRPPFADSAIVHQVVTQLRADADGALGRWIARHAIPRARQYATAGDVVDRIVNVADEEKAALIVVGSRRLSLAMRIYASTVGPDVAGTARCPVMVVATK